ncbi:class I SAM-dependent methyltransferase [Gordonia sp. OPL2]|uniref:class I SAM-dependent methyltransferase n=1 Tax=Gordonia sp. OPL2 TaxID=2486274 RepID=UPI0016551494|nr:class I SAM-dependent methyltransferase [Gordonia sp. OPL2]RPA12607.1 class I SAM-dependent methyltransferase [Gordonia sp. OPL2]
MAMNLLHRVCCSSRPWAAYTSRSLVPWTLDDVTLGVRTIEIGPGYGANMASLLERTGHLTAIEIDSSSAARLTDRFGDRARIIAADGTDAGLPDGSYSSVVCFTMLHHVPTVALQDRLFAEAARMLEPGGVFAGSDGRHSRAFRAMHIGDTYNPVFPEDLADRLRTAGFQDVEVATGPVHQRWRAVTRGR